MTGVILGQSAILMLLFTVRGHVRPIGGNGCRGWDPRDSLSCQRAQCVPRTRQKYAKTVGHSRAYFAEVGESSIFDVGN
jgi:hypothetical protein